MARGSRVRLESVAFWTLLAVGLALVVVLVAIIVGVVPVNEGASGTEPAPPASAATAPATTATPPETEPEPEPEPATAPTAPPGVLVRAVGGDCWVEAREGSPTGRVLYVGLLVQGTAQRLPGRRVWLRLGAGENVVVMAGGRRTPVPPGTNDVVVSA